MTIYAPRLEGRVLARLAAAFIALAPALAAGQTAPTAPVKVDGPPRVVFDPALDACDGHDVPDVPARAFRDEKGQIALLAMHFENRALRGADFDSLKLDCQVVFRGSGSADPGAYDDRAWIAATWTEDGRRIAALAHHEYQGNTHPGRCALKDYMACWWNVVLALSSQDGGRTFAKARQPVVAAFPFGQEVGQGRHRGFFNPSNIVRGEDGYYMIASTTGWTGQDGGACLFRTADPHDPAGWRAFDGTGFTVRFTDPYGKPPPDPLKTCRTIAPFPAPVGSLTRHRPSGAWIAVFQARENGADFPVSGFYVATSRDLKSWGAPRLVMAGKTLYDDPCGAGTLISYPSLIDRRAEGRNFDDTGDEAELYYAVLRVDGCTITSDRRLVRQGVKLAP